MVAVVAVVARVTQRLTRTGRPLVAVVAVVARVTNIYVQADPWLQWLQWLRSRVTQTYTYRQTLGCSGCESDTDILAGRPLVAVVAVVARVT